MPSLILPVVLAIITATAAAPLPQYDAYGYKPYQESFFGPSPINREALRNPYGFNPNPYAASPYYGGSPPAVYPGHPPQGYQHEMAPVPHHDPTLSGFTAPGEPLPPVAYEPVLEPIDLMSAPKSALPKPPSPEEDGEPESGENFLSPSPSAEIQSEPKIKALRPDDEPKGVAGTGWYLDAARKDHKVSPTSDMRKVGDWADSRDRKNRFNPNKGGFRGSMGPDDNDKPVTEEERQEGAQTSKDGEKEEKEEEEKAPEPEPLPPVEVKPAKDGRLKYEVHIGGAGSGMKSGGGEGGERDDGGEGSPEGPSNFHTWTQEGTKKLTGDSMDPECQKYIQEKMLPKLGGRKKKGTQQRKGECVFSVFGDD